MLKKVKFNQWNPQKALIHAIVYIIINLVFHKKFFLQFFVDLKQKHCCTKIPLFKIKKIPREEK